MLNSEFIEFLAMAFVALGSITLPLSIILCFHARNLSKREQCALTELSEVIENLGEGLYRTSIDGKLLSANPALVALHGYRTEVELINSVNDIATEWYVDPHRRDEFKKLLAQKGKVRNFVSEIYRHKTKERIWVSESARLVLDPISGKPAYYEGTLIETTEIMVRMQEEEKLTKLTTQVPGGLFQLVRINGGEYRVAFASSGFKELLDWTSDQKKFDIKNFVSLIHPEDIEGYNLSLRASRKSGHVWSFDFRVVTNAGNTKWLKLNATPETKTDGTTIWHGYLQDITNTKADEVAIRNLAYRDSLTKLPNRRSFVEQLEQKIASCQRMNEYAGMLFIDIDNFKLLNDSYGHDVGDTLLVQIAKRLKQVVRRNDTVARLAGDEFVVLLDHLGSNRAEATRKATAIAEKVKASFAQEFHLGHMPYFSTASIGGISFNGDGDSVDDLMRKADFAMYEVKKSGRNGVRLYDEMADDEAQKNSNIAREIIGLADRDELELRFQPQLNRQGKICGAEALVRWNHAVHGLMSPNQFLWLAEHSGQMAQINNWILEQAFKVLRDWQANPATKHLRLAVNLGLQQIYNDGLANQIMALSKVHKVDVSKLTLELTEKLLIKNRIGHFDLIKRLKITGVRLSLDDFGVDFSSLSLLADMPLDEIKIDGKFVKSMHKRPQDMALVKSILAMAEALGLATVAEHVETQPQEKMLMEFGCGAFQGFLYGGAMCRADFEMAACHNSSIKADTRVKILAA